MSGDNVNLEEGTIKQDLDEKSDLKQEPSDSKKIDDSLLNEFYAQFKTEPIVKKEVEIKQENINNVDIDNSKAKEESNEEKDSKKEDDPLLSEFYSEIDEIKGVDFKTNSVEQINRLLRPGSTYFNLNPFDVLQIDPYTPIEEVKKKYRKLSIYVHPDKNKDDLERAQQAFEALNKAYKMLEDEKERKRCLEVVDEARERVDNTIIEKRKKFKGAKIDEDDPDKYRQAIYTMSCKLFADLERLRIREAEKKAEEKKRRADEKTSDESKSKVQKQWDKNYEESREGRISSWQDFKTKGKVHTATTKIPKHKPETR